MLADALGHFLGVGPLAVTLGSPYTIGSFEAHGLAVVLGALLLRAAGLADRRPWHAAGASIHVLLGGSNLLFWPSFAAMGVVPVGVVTTAFHLAFVVAQAICLWTEGASSVTRPAARAS